MNRILLGMLTPSSNTVLEPITTAMLSELPEVTVHFSRFPVTEISLTDNGLAQFTLAPVLAAARLVADAGVRVIAWSGTSAGWLGLGRDEELCAEVERHTGVKGTSSTLGLADIFRRTRVKRYGLVTPYLGDVQARIVENFAAEGWTCAAESHLGEACNFAFSNVTEDQLRDMVRAVAKSKPDAVVIFCTNLRGAPITAELEDETGIPIYDSVSTALWSSLRLADVDTRRVRGWGSLFENVM